MNIAGNKGGSSWTYAIFGFYSAVCIQLSLLERGARKGEWCGTAFPIGDASFWGPGERSDELPYHLAISCPYSNYSDRGQTPWLKLT